MTARAVAESTFVSLVRGLSDAEFVSFVADLWAARGYDTSTDGRVVVATRDGDRSHRLEIRCLDGGGTGRRWLPARRLDVGEIGPADVVVSRRVARRPESPDGPTAARWVDEHELYRITLYAIDREAAEALFQRYFGREVTEPETHRREPATEPGSPLSARAVLVGLAALFVVLALLGVGVYGLGDEPPGQVREPVGSGGVTDPETPDTAPPTPVGVTFTQVRTPEGTEPADVDTDDTEAGPSRFPGNVSRSSWPMFQSTASRTGIGNTTAPRRAVRVVGQRSGSSTADSPVESSPAVVAGNAFVGAGNADRNDGLVSRVTLDPFERQWTVRLGSAVTSSPAVRNETVYVGSTRASEAADRDFLPDANLYALNATNGYIRWGFEMGPVERSSPAVVGDTVYVGSTDQRVYAVWATNGSERWNRTTGGTILSSPAVHDGTLYVGSADGRLYAFDAETGHERWSASLAPRITSTPAVADGRVFVGSEDGDVYALDAANGTVRWVVRTGGRVPASPAVRNGSVFVGSYDGTLYRIDAATGDVRWRVPTGAPVFASAAVTETTVYAGNVNGTVYAVDVDSGEVLWTFATGDRLLASPAVADGRLVVATVDRLYVLGERTAG